MLLKALPFLVSYVTVPMVLAAAWYGGWWIAAPFAWGWIGVSLFDRLLGLNRESMDPATPDAQLFWHKLLTWSWPPVQFATMAATLWLITRPGHLETIEAVGVAAALGIAIGGIGITVGHEMIHQRSRWERLAGEALFASVCYGHFATEHIFGHHRTVGTPADPVTARRGESLYAFLNRAIPGSLVSAWRIDVTRLARRGRAPWHRTNPFWRYAAVSALWLGFALWAGGLHGLGLFLLQGWMAIFQLEAVNYVEHYGLTRRYLGAGRFESVAPRHSWNASHTFSNWFLLNLQRHSDHHYRPDRRFALLQHHAPDNAPQLPCNYAQAVVLAQIPPLFFRVMNPRLDRWRVRFYPDIADWSEYDAGTIGQRDAGAAVRVPA